MERILLVEDDDTILRFLTDYLRSEGYTVSAASGQEEAVDAMAGFSPDLLLVDISLSQGNGFGVCAAAKEKGLPVIFLTASDDEYSVVTGLDMGADDYIAKPFRPRELLSRIRSVLRRYGKQQRQITLGEVGVDMEKGTVTRNGSEIFLSALEYKLLLMLLTHRGQTMSRNRLLEEIWDLGGDYVSDNTLTVYIKRLREKLGDDPQNPSLIKTVRGFGYRIEVAK